MPRRQPLPVISASAPSTVAAEGASDFFCSRPWTGFEISAENGSVSMCCWAKQPYGYVLTQSVAEIWNGDAIRRMRKQMATGRFTEICGTDCPYVAGLMTDVSPHPTSPVFARNLALNQSEIHRRAERLESLPRYWKIGHSTLCNLDCIMCYQSRDNPHALPDSVYRELKNYYAVMQELLLIGGEPMMIPQIRRVIRELGDAHPADLGVLLITNGTVHDARTLALVARLPLAGVLISVDAARPETYAQIRRPGTLGRVLRGIRAWRTVTEPKGVKLKLAFTVMRDNVRELAEFVELAFSERVDCSFAPVVGTKADQHLIPRDVLQSEVQRALDMLDRLKTKGEMGMARGTLRTLERRSTVMFV